MVNCRSLFLFLVLLTSVHSQAIRAADVVFKGHDDRITDLGFTPDGARLVSSSMDGTLKAWNVRTGKCLGTLEGHEGAVQTLTISPNGKGVASGGADNSIKLWSLSSYECIRTFAPPSVQKDAINDEISEQTDPNDPSDRRFKTGVVDISFSANSRYIASGHGDRTIIVWDSQKGTFQTWKGKLLDTFTDKAPFQRVFSVALSPDGKLVAAGEKDFKHLGSISEKTTFVSKVLVWDAFSKEVKKNIDLQRSVIFLTFSPDGKKLTSGSITGEVMVWDLARTKAVRSLKYGKIIQSMNVSGDGKYLAAASNDGVRIFDLETGSERSIKNPMEGEISAVGVSSTGNYVAVGDREGNIKIQEVKPLPASLMDDPKAR